MVEIQPIITKKSALTLVLLGFMPYIYSAVANLFIFNMYMQQVIPYIVVSLVFVVGWFFFGRYSYGLTENSVVAILLGHAVGGVAWVFLTLQLLVFDGFMADSVGWLVNHYFDPSMFGLSFEILLLTGVTINNTVIDTLSLVLMVGVFWLGHRSRWKKETTDIQ